MSTQPPVLGDCIFSVSGSSVIDAPAEKIFDAILDFKSYKLWNPFVRKQIITDARKNPLADRSPAVGEYIAMNVNLPPTLDDSSVGFFGRSSVLVIITALDREGFKVAWKSNVMPSWLMSSERWQWLTEVEADLGDGKGRRKLIRYDSTEMFGGFVAYLVKWFVGGKLKLGFQAQADGLKRWAERVP